MKRFVIFMLVFLSCSLFLRKESQDGWNISSSTTENVQNQLFFSTDSNSVGTFALRNGKVSVPASVLAIRKISRSFQRFSNRILNLCLRNVLVLQCSHTHSDSFFMFSGVHAVKKFHVADYILFRHLTI